MKTFILNGKGDFPNIPFCMGDLIALPQPLALSFDELSKLIDQSRYHAETRNWTYADYYELYAKPGNAGKDFFEIRDTGIIVIPGNYLFPTLLTETDLLQTLAL